MTIFSNRDNKVSCEARSTALSGALLAVILRAGARA